MDRLSLGSVVPQTAEQELPNIGSTRDQRQLRVEVSNAARRLNEAGYAGEGREITFSLNPDTRRPIIKVVDIDTREVVQEWPSDFLLKLVENLNP